MQEISYKQSGVDVALGDECSKIAYGFARKTFANRKNCFACPADLENGFSGLVDMGDFYLAFNCDGVGSKIEVAQRLNKYDTLGYDLAAMVADDAVCLGAEPVSLVNTIDIEKTDKSIIEELMKGLEAASYEAGVFVAGGEIAEMPSKVKGVLWSASLVGVVKKEKLLGKHKVKEGDAIVGLLTGNLRSNGFTLARKILLDYFGAQWHTKKFDDGKTWGQALLEPSKIFTPFILKLTGKFDEPAKIDIHAVAHITGGGIYNNTKRVLPEGLRPEGLRPEGLRADFNNLPSPPKVFRDLIALGNVRPDEAHNTWNMGVGMVIITPEPDTVLNMARENDVPAQVVGKVVSKE